MLGLEETVGHLEMSFSSSWCGAVQGREMLTGCDTRAQSLERYIK